MNKRRVFFQTQYSYINGSRSILGHHLLFIFTVKLSEEFLPFRWLINIFFKLLSGRSVVSSVFILLKRLSDFFPPTTSLRGTLQSLLFSCIVHSHYDMQSRSLSQVRIYHISLLRTLISSQTLFPCHHIFLRPML